jgi:hypothetical protein
MVAKDRAIGNWAETRLIWPNQPAVLGAVKVIFSGSGLPDEGVLYALDGKSWRRVGK